MKAAGLSGPPLGGGCVVLGVGKDNGSPIRVPTCPLKIFEPTCRWKVEEMLAKEVARRERDPTPAEAAEAVLEAIVTEIEVRGGAATAPHKYSRSGSFGCSGLNQVSRAKIWGWIQT